MTSVFIRILAFAAFASLPLLAQQPSSSPSPQPPASSSPQATPPQQTNPQPGASENGNKAVPVPGTANAPEVANPQMRPVTGELENKLDSKDAKTGDSVVVKTTETATTASGVEIPKGSKIMGHIVDVAPKGQGGDNSRVTIQFDQAQLQSGKSLPIRSVIQSLAPPGTTAGSNAAGGPAATMPSGGSAATGGGAGMTPSSPSGNSTSPSAASPNASQPGAAASQPGEAGPGAGGSEPAPGTVVATRGNLAIRTTGIPGVLLIGSVTGQPFSNAAGALLGAKQDVHLDGGTVMVVAIAAAPAPAPVSGR